MRAAAAIALALVLAACGHQGSGPSDADRKAAERLAGTWCALHDQDAPPLSDTSAHAAWWTRCVEQRTRVELRRIATQHDIDQRQSDLERTGQ